MGYVIIKMSNSPTPPLDFRSAETLCQAPEGIILQSKTNNQIWTGVVWEGHRSGVRTNAPNPLAPQAYHRMGR